MNFNSLDVKIQAQKKIDQTNKEKILSKTLKLQEKQLETDDEFEPGRKLTSKRKVGKFSKGLIDTDEEDDGKDPDSEASIRSKSIK